jgi:CRP-like cAMP-binding protein
MHVNAGQVLWRASDVSDSFYIVINGRLRAITEDHQGVVNIVAEYGQGDTAGEIDVITSTPRRNTVHAIRDTELIRMPQTLFNAIFVAVSFYFIKPRYVSSYILETRRPQPCKFFFCLTDPPSSKSIGYCE